MWEDVEAGGETLEAIPPIADPHRDCIDQDMDPGTVHNLSESHWKNPEFSSSLYIVWQPATEKHKRRDKESLLWAIPGIHTSAHRGSP